MSSFPFKILGQVQHRFTCESRILLGIINKYKYIVNVLDLYILIKFNVLLIIVV